MTGGRATAVPCRGVQKFTDRCLKGPARDWSHSTLDPKPVSRQIHTRMHNVVERNDPAWVLEAARRCAAEERTPPDDVTLAARAQAEASRTLAPEVVRGELEQMLLGRGVHVALQWLHECGLLGVWLPELEATVDFSQEAGRKHKDVWEHTKQVVRQSVPRPAVRWAALLHDIGKVPTRTYTADGGVHLHRHAQVGARMSEDVARRFRFDKPMKQKLKFL